MYEKITGHSYLSHPGVELGGLKDWYVSKIILYWNGKVDSISGWTLPKLPIISKNYSNESCWELNFVQKSQWAHMSIFPRSRARSSKDWYASNIILYWNGKVDLISGLTLPKLPIISESGFNKNCWALNFVQKIQWAHMSISPRSGACEDWYISNIILYWNGKVDSFPCWTLTFL